MKDPHCERDAQNWHIIGFDLVSEYLLIYVFQFNQKFKRSTLKHLRLQLKQPSPNWLDNTLRNLTCFSKKVQLKTVETPSRPINAESKDAFAAFKSKIKQNLRGLNQEDCSTEKQEVAGVPTQ